MDCKIDCSMQDASLLRGVVRGKSKKGKEVSWISSCGRKLVRAEGEWRGSAGPPAASGNHTERSS